MNPLKILLLPIIFPSKVLMAFFQDFYYSYTKHHLELDGDEPTCGMQSPRKEIEKFE